MYSDTSKYATGSALYQIQNEKPKLIAHASKRLPGAAHNYSITELEMCGLAINIASFAHLLRKVDFDAVVDHLAITQIIRSKVESATTRIKRLLEVLGSYSFNFYYIKGKDMILSDFLSRQKVNHSNPCKIIPISFSMRAVLQPEVHGSRKGLDPHNIPEKQLQPIASLDIEKKPRMGQGRVGMRRKIKALPSQYTGPGSSESKPIIIYGEAVSVAEPVLPKPITEIPRSEVLPPYPLPQNRPPPKPPDQLIKKQDASDTKTDIEENLPFQENIISEIYERPYKSYFQEPIELKDLTDTKIIIQ